MTIEELIYIALILQILAIFETSLKAFIFIRKIVICGQKHFPVKYNYQQDMREVWKSE